LISSTVKRIFPEGPFDWMLNPYALVMGLFSLVALTWHDARTPTEIAS
jgi:hypothetical protein